MRKGGTPDCVVEPGLTEDHSRPSEGQSPAGTQAGGELSEERSLAPVRSRTGPY